MIISQISSNGAVCSPKKTNYAAPNFTGKTNLASKALSASVLDPAQENLLNRVSRRYNYKKFKPLQAAAKRAVDYIGASTLMLATSPFVIISGALVKLETKGPVIFKQERIGKNGKPFTVYKLRTMSEVVDAQGNKENKITKVGKVLRKLSIDEFPQFLNIIKGDMSIIGPRPLVRKEIEQLLKNNPNSVRRLSVLPGASINYSQVKASDADIRIKDEKNYLDNWNFALDMKIIMSLAKRVISGGNT